MNGRTRLSLVWLGLTLALVSCSEDDPVAPLGNSAPEEVRLIGPADGQAGIDGALTLSWDPATDPDGDAVTYTVYLDGTVDPTTPVASNISATQHVVTTSLELETTYSWKVTAADGNGGMSTSVVRTFATRVNDPPAPFALLDVPDNATGVEATPTLSWAAAVDPDGDPVAYDVFLGTQPNPTTAVASDITTLSHAVTPALGSEMLYYWRVVARDALGAETSSATQRFTTRSLVSATLATDDAAFGARSGHTSLVYDGRMWVIGGSTCCGGRFSDVWFSTDGESWTLVTADAEFDGRTVHAAVVHAGKMWIMGGNSAYRAGSEFSDVWSSSDGATWIQESADAEFGPRYAHCAVSFDDKLWIYGGQDASKSYSTSQVWQSTDGASWALVSDNASFGRTASFQITEFQGALYKTGGRDDSVFRSEDGINWAKIAESAEYGVREKHTSVVFDEKLWLIGGFDQRSSLPDVWFSVDGATWERAAADAGYRPVVAHTSVVFDGKIWVIAGGGGSGSSFVSNEVYSLGY